MAKCIQCGKSGLLLHVNNEGLCDNCVQLQIQKLKNSLSPEQKTVLRLQDEIEVLTDKRTRLNDEVNRLQQQIANNNSIIEQKKSQIIELDDTILLQEFGLYEPKYDFCNSEEYKSALDKIRQKQKELIKNDRALSGNMNWTVNNSLSQGRKMIHDIQKLLLRAFNTECDEIINRVKYNNFDASLKRIASSRDSISKLGSAMSIVITTPYYEAKVEELTLSFEYQQKKQQEKEEQKELRAQMKEEAKLQKEIEEARKKAEKEEKHYHNALLQLDKQIENASESEKEDLLNKRIELEAHIAQIESNLKEIDYREANQKAGYVYVISNIGSFGENIYKIGMTRRLEPMERIDELGDASVPFDFDVHALIFSDNAPALEAALHKAFENRKVNMVNTRREFFNVTLDEIKSVVKANFDKTTEFVETAAAEQYRITQKMKENIV